MRWIEVIVNCTTDPEVMSWKLADLGVGGMIMEDEADFPQAVGGRDGIYLHADGGLWLR